MLNLCTLSISNEFCRGPAKGYIEALEARLFETEEVLHKVLPCVSTEDLARVLVENPLDAKSSSRAVALDRKQAVQIWSRSPMKSLADIQNWCDERSRTAESASESTNSTSLHQDPASYASFQRATTPKEHGIPAAVEQQALRMVRLPTGQVGRVGIETTPTEMSFATGPMPYETGVDTQSMQQSQSQQNPQSQPQHYDQPSSQYQFEHTRGSSTPPNQISSGAVTENFEQHNGAGTNSFGITQKFQDDFLW